MIEYLKETRPTVTRDIWHAFLFDTLTGQGANEACNAIKLIQQDVKGLMKNWVHQNTPDIKNSSYVTARMLSYLWLTRKLQG